MFFLLIHHLKTSLKYVIEVKESEPLQSSSKWKASMEGQFLIGHYIFKRLEKKNQRTVLKDARNKRIPFHLSGSSYTLILLSYCNQYQGKQNVQEIIIQQYIRHAGILYYRLR